MIRQRVPLCLALTALSVSRSFGALGDSLEEAFKRYGADGQRVQFHVSAGHRTEVIRWAHMFSPDIEVHFDNGIAIRVRIEGNVSPPKWDFYLKMNAKGQKWNLLNWSSGEYAPAEWRRDDGARAYYFRRVFEFFGANHPELQPPGPPRMELSQPLGPTPTPIEARN